MHLRTTWKGSLNVSLLSLRVKAYSTTAPQGETVQLHQLHAACQSRIRYHKVCPEHGQVPTDQIVMGYEQAPQQHVVIDLVELDRLRRSRLVGFSHAATTSRLPQSIWLALAVA